MDKPGTAHIHPTEFDPTLEAWLDAQITYWGSEECVVIAKVAVDALRTVANWRRGPGVLDHALPTGTPLATFLDREGRPSPLYDAGIGLGKTGNRTTHAAVLAGYDLARGGTIRAIKVYEVYPGSGGVRRKLYPVDDSAFGTGNARNYHAILDHDLTPLGGAANPFFPIWQKTHPLQKATPLAHLSAKQGPGADREGASGFAEQARQFKE